MSRMDDMEKFLDELGPIVDGDRAAIERHADFLATDDRARDLRHEAEEAAEALAAAGDDWVMPADLEAKVLAAIDAKASPADETGRTTQPGFDPGEVKKAIAEAEASAPIATTSEPAMASEATEPAMASEPATAKSEPAAPRTIAMTEPAEVVSIEAARAERAPAPVRTAPSKSGMGRVIVLFSALATMGVAAAGAAIALWPSGPNDSPTTTSPTLPTGALTGTLAQVVRAAAGETGTGVEIMPAGGNYAPLAIGATLPAGATIRTDERTRARVTLSDGSELVLNHSTEVLLDAQQSRHFDLRAGEVVADIAHLDAGPMAVFTTPSGRVNVVGTSFVLAATQDVSSVRVTRGKVRVASDGSPEVEVEAGEEGLLRSGRPPEVAPTVALARAVAWASLDEDNSTSTTEASTVPGVGSLRAHRPGEREDRERPLFVQSQHVRVRIAGNVARTEIEQVFQNDSGDELEGMYRFPLPSDARISRLALEVDGQLQEGAFVARNRASQIWAGVIRHATPVSHRDPHEEYIWVPGPWRDPALLEWQRGGNFELRIFPIPAHGSRRIVLAYTQVIPPTAEGRRYVYPLAHSRDGSLRIGELDVDVRVSGARAVHARGYALDQASTDGAQVLHYAARDFLPAGDIVVDYERPEGESELSYYAYTGAAATAPPERSRERDDDVVAAQRALAADTRGYVAFALHPRLPARTEGRAHDYVIVVDSSQSMVGERFQRASSVVLGMIAEMDRRDRFTLLACDFECRSMDSGNTPRGMRTPSSSEVADATEWLSHLEPAGSSDLIATLRSASRVAERAPSSDGSTRDVHVIYVGDGIASTGHRGAGAIATAVESLATSEHVAFTTLGIGQEADSVTLAAIARAGGGHYVPFVPGERSASTALAVLETTYGVSLRDAAVTMPEGLSEMAPTELPTIRAGEEVVIVARMDRSDVTGNVTLRGTVGGAPFEQTYPVHVVASTSAGNLFVPALWASGTIERLELESRGEDEPRIIALSRAYSVMSRHTSMLVLESEAMFRAFGVDRTESTAQWTGEEEADGEVAAGEAAIEGDLQRQAALGHIGTLGRSAGGYASGSGAGGLLDDDVAGAEAEEARRDHADPREPAATSSSATRASSATPAPAPPAPDTAATPAQRRARGPSAPIRVADPSIGGGRMGQWMHRVWYRVGEVTDQSVPAPREIEAASRAEEELRLAPDSRDRHRAAVRALARVGRLDRALEISESWISRDRLDPEALAARADVLGRMGRRDEAIRVLSGVVDLRPDDQVLQERLASSLERAGDTERACASRVAIAESHLTDPALLAAAIRCERATGARSLADALVASVREERTRARALDLAEDLPTAPSSHRDLSIEASWSGAVDLDITLVAPDGTRISWMGGRTTVTGRDASAIGHETLGLRTATVGTYVVEISRTQLDDRRPIMGEVRIRTLDANRTLQFRLDHERVEVARARIRRESRLEPVR